MTRYGECLAEAEFEVKGETRARLEPEPSFRNQPDGNSAPRGAGAVFRRKDLADKVKG